MVSTILLLKSQEKLLPLPKMVTQVLCHELLFTTKSPSSFLYPVNPEMIRKVFLSFVNLTFLEVTKTLVDDSIMAL